MSSSFEEDFRKSQFNEDDEEENTQSLRPGKNLNPDRSLNPSHPFARDNNEESSFPKAQFTSIGGTSLLMRAAWGDRSTQTKKNPPREQILSKTAGDKDSSKSSKDKNLGENVWETFERGSEIKKDFISALGYAREFLPEALGILTDDMKNLVEGVMIGILFAIGLGTLFSIIGGIIGGIVGALFGGVGAAPGTVAGAKAGADVAFAILQFLGLSFLTIEAVKQGSTVATTFGNFITAVIEANGNEAKLKSAGRHFAVGLAELLYLIVLSLLAYAAAKGKTKTLQRLENTRFGKIVGIAKLNDFLSKTDLAQKNLQGARSHLTKNDFVARSQVKAPKGKIKLKNGTQVSTQNQLPLELAPVKNPKTAKITQIEVFNDKGTSLGLIKPPKTPGSPKAVWQVPADPKYKLKVTSKDGKQFTFVPGTSLPSRFRYKLNTKKSDLRDRGLAGGHTRRTWNEVMQRYGDKINVLSRKKIKFKVPGQEKPVEVDFIRYEVKGINNPTGVTLSSVNQPKSIFTGSGKAAESNLVKFEKMIASQTAQVINKAQNQRGIKDININVTGKNGNTTTVKVKVAFEKNKVANRPIIKTWWITENNWNNTNLR